MSKGCPILWELAWRWVLSACNLCGFSWESVLFRSRASLIQTIAKAQARLATMEPEHPATASKIAIIAPYAKALAWAPGCRLWLRSRWKFRARTGAARAGALLPLRKMRAPLIVKPRWPALHPTSRAVGVALTLTFAIPSSRLKLKTVS